MIKRVVEISKTNPWRTLILLAADVVLLIGAAGGAFLLRFENIAFRSYVPEILLLACLNVLITIPLAWTHRLYTMSLTYISVRDLYRLIKAVLTSALAITVVIFILRDYRVIDSFPRSTLLINTLLSLVLLGFVRVVKRMAREIKSFRTGARLLIIGAGEQGAHVVRALTTDSRYTVIGFLDDDTAAQSVTIHGIPVLGSTDHLAEYVSRHAIDQIIITDQTYTKRTVDRARDTSFDLTRIKVLPTLSDIMDGRVVLAQLRDISIEDLLGRDRVVIDTSLMRSFLEKKCVLVTGAAGSIGAELARQILQFNPSRLVLIDQNESGMFTLVRRLSPLGGGTIVAPFIADVCDRTRLERIMLDSSPDIVFHAAAYKHVPVMEKNPLAAIQNNIFGTWATAWCAAHAGAQTYIFISTDKAVRPVSIMGATKHIGEMICVYLNRLGKTKYCAVRFGNVLDSQGNVVELFREQIKHGGPVEVTHPAMERYFMVTAEACALVMQAGALCRGGEIFCLDMGSPVRIVDLAREMIRLAGFTADKDISIVFTGARPGERLGEELLIANETPTHVEKLFIARLHGEERCDSLEETLSELKRAVEENNEERACSIISKLVPTYRAQF